MNILIREYHESDFPALCAIHDAARKIELHYAKLDDAFLPLVDVVESEGLFEYAHVEVGVAGGEVVAFMAYSDEELAWLYVRPDLFRHGIGRQMTAHALETEPGICAIECLCGNEPARLLYEAMGFEVKEIIRGVMPGNERFRVEVYGMERPVQ